MVLHDEGAGVVDHLDEEGLTHTYEYYYSERVNNDWPIAGAELDIESQYSRHKATSS